MVKAIAQSLLDIEAVSLSPNDMFTWSSGIKSPIYCDNRITLGFPEVREAIRDGLVELIEKHFPDVDIVSGTATAGIPHAAYVSDKMNLPMNYVRSKSKSHGKQNQIEGANSNGKKVVVIEDLISTGGSSITAVEALREAGAEVLGVVAIFTYGLQKADDMFGEAKVPFYTISNYDELIEVAEAQGKITSEDIDTLVSWRNQL
ncbi:MULTISPECIES: orotate phosphoribosyltransferase [unclassified Staphylococcus]|uniref:orotate phosphoribosyltransferase n=1 Tax=unclassified Staphylococcus TaxID=91994 RepID=UPI0021D0CD05|nr:MULTISPECIES: orotate phosphoribosyltransferase [unclassified Staphylococcus]UXR70338.1 orotate phosphoribosyltransferase [Staphylococcus sp. IVB6246]UXR72404.1 orotate phosphoribosyltransferase [Staphylococcus sp. IVB6240]UXR74709.1 orotate phosphoribosyltransferase [Staphylococcus sp. IVB6238]UXR77041.1 orotate phosphoribosyltransferase [Staphylococcus sp. IVB6233]UXR81166.1 orotate phosphoribosyltransferase [Staphylococcus sp. IVB6218]